MDDPLVQALLIPLLVYATLRLFFVPRVIALWFVALGALAPLVLPLG